MEKYGNPEVGEVAESPRACFDDLNFGVEPLRYCVRNSVLEEIADVRVVPLNRLGRINHRL